jgi:hypothetical protein
VKRIFPVLLTLVLCACAPVDPYRVSNDGYANTCEYRAPGDCPAASLLRNEAPAPYKLAFVEIDEQGYFADRAQAEAAIAMASEKPARGRAYVVVFIHGWHHNAGPDDENVHKFHDALRLISSWRPNDTVRGVYIGWRGDSIAIKGVRFITFWDRKNTSDEVGRGSLYEFLLRLEHSVKAPGSVDSRLVLIGHSFGASVAFNSLAQLYMQRFIEGLYSTSAGPRFRGYGDFAVLINPAIEGVRFMPFHGALKHYTSTAAGVRADFSRESRPALVILSSEGDWATRKTFPAARFFSTVFEAHTTAGIQGSAPGKGDGYSEWVMDVQTLANFENFHTHAPLKLAGAGEKAPGSCAPLASGQLRQFLANIQSAPQQFPDSGIVLKHKGTLPATTPYWSADMSSDIVASHSDIGKPSLVCWIMQLVDAN